MDRTYIIGIDLGGTNLKIGLSRASCALIEKQVLSTTSFADKSALIEAICGAVNGIIRSHGISVSAVRGVGLGLPGPIDTSRGMVHYFPNIPGWREVKLRDILRKKLRIPVFIDNDANLMALAEFSAGAARGSRNAVCITLGTGVGGGLIIDGRLFRGSTFAAGEAGHMPVSFDGPRCGCGAYGCLESYIGNRRIMAKAREIFGKDMELEELSRMARNGNRKALKIWHEAGRILGGALAGIVNLLNPDTIVIGGGVANAGEVLLRSVRETVACRAMPLQARHVKIVKASLSDAGIIGACILVREKGC